MNTIYFPTDAKVTILMDGTVQVVVEDNGAFDVIRAAEELTGDGCKLKSIGPVTFFRKIDIDKVAAEMSERLAAGATKK